MDGETASILGVGSRHCKGELHEDDECGEEEHVGCVGCCVRWCLLYCPGADEDAVSWEDKTTEEGETPLLVKRTPSKVKKSCRCSVSLCNVQLCLGLYLEGKSN